MGAQGHAGGGGHQGGATGGAERWGYHGAWRQDLKRVPGRWFLGSKRQSFGQRQGQEEALRETEGRGEVPGEAGGPGLPNPRTCDPGTQGMPPSIPEVQMETAGLPRPGAALGLILTCELQLVPISPWVLRTLPSALLAAQQWWSRNHFHLATLSGPLPHMPAGLMASSWDSQRG